MSLRGMGLAAGARQARGNRAQPSAAALACSQSEKLRYGELTAHTGVDEGAHHRQLKNATPSGRAAAPSRSEGRVLGGCRPRLLSGGKMLLLGLLVMLPMGFGQPLSCMSNVYDCKSNTTAFGAGPATVTNTMGGTTTGKSVTTKFPSRMMAGNYALRRLCTSSAL